VKVGYVLDRYAVLTQTFVRLEIEELRRQGVDVEVFALRRGDVEPVGEGVTYLRELPGGKVRHGAAHARAFAADRARYRRFRRTVRDLASERGEMIPRRLPVIAELIAERGVEHLHAHFAWSGAAAAQALATLTGLPWSLTVHGNDLFAQTRNLDVKLAAADTVVTVCDYNRRWLLDHHGVEASVVVCGVEVPVEGASGPPLVDVVFAGRLVEKKGVDVLLGAARLLPDVSFEVIGDGPLREVLEAVAPTNVRFRGALPHAATLNRIGQAALLCLPARVASDGDRDSMPLVVKEAMVRGVPAVVTDAVGLPEAVDETCGWLVPPDDVDGLAAALAAALTSDDERSRRGAAARARVTERFTLAGEVAKLRALFGTPLVLEGAS
jgi:glycosyltransferase involved in cell wall biosynthesis